MLQSNKPALFLVLLNSQPPTAPNQRPRWRTSAPACSPAPISRRTDRAIPRSLPPRCPRLPRRRHHDSSSSCVSLSILTTLYTYVCVCHRGKGGGGAPQNDPVLLVSSTHFACFRLASPVLRGAARGRQQAGKQLASSPLRACCVWCGVVW